MFWALAAMCVFELWGADGALGAVYQLVVTGSCNEASVTVPDEGMIKVTVVHNDISCCANSGCGGYTSEEGPTPCGHPVKLWGGGEEVVVDVSKWEGNVGDSYEVEVKAPLKLFGQYMDTYCSDNTPTGSWKDSCKSQTIFNVLDSSIVVNDAGDAEDTDPSDGQCVTGTVEGKVLCTLRAAMQEANAQAGPSAIYFNLPTTGEGPLPVLPEKPLPVLDDSTVLDGASQPGDAPVVIDGANVGQGNGLHIMAGTLELVDLTVRSFPGHGVYAVGDADVHARNVVITGNCGWGIHGTGAIHINDGEEVPQAWSRIAENGVAEGCDGGGLVSLEAGVSVRLTEVVDNGGTGILGKKGLNMTQVKVSGNLGDGAATPTGVIHVDGAYLDGPVGEFSSNRGAGLRAFGTCDNWGCTEAIRVQGAVLVEENGSWGIHATGAISLGEVDLNPTKHLSKVSQNGKGSDCRRSELTSNGVKTETLECIGGGLVSGEKGIRAFHVEVGHNGGPGILASGSVDLQGARLFANGGQGVYATQGHVWFHLAGGVLPKSQVVDNLGNGIETFAGCPDSDTDCDDVMIEGGMTVSGNGGWGILSHRKVTVGEVQFADGYEWSFVSNNGHGEECSWWYLNEGTPEVVATDCGGGGILSLKGAVDVHVTELKFNRGPGVLADDRIFAEGAIVEENGGEGLRSEWGQVVIPASVQPTTVRGNGAAGIHARGTANLLGDPIPAVEVRGELQVSFNASAGIYAAGAIVVGEVEPGIPVAQRSRIVGNGVGDLCEYWRIDGASAVGETGPCDPCGILSEGYDGPLPVVLRNTDVDNNKGDGLRVDGEGEWVRAELTDVSIGWNKGVGLWANGDVEYTAGLVCNNAVGNVQVTGNRNFTDVKVCPEPPSSSGDDAGPRAGEDVASSETDAKPDGATPGKGGSASCVVGPPDSGAGAELLFVLLLLGLMELRRSRQT